MSVENFPEPWQKKLADLATAYGIEIEELTVTENGTYSEEGKAYSPVTVNVSGGGTEYNIKYYDSANEEYFTGDLGLVYLAEYDLENEFDWIATETAVNKAAGGIMLAFNAEETSYNFEGVCIYAADLNDSGYIPYKETVNPGVFIFQMPQNDLVIVGSQNVT